MYRVNIPLVCIVLVDTKRYAAIIGRWNPLYQHNLMAIDGVFWCRRCQADATTTPTLLGLCKVDYPSPLDIEIYSHNDHITHMWPIKLTVVSDRTPYPKLLSSFDTKPLYLYTWIHTKLKELVNFVLKPKYMLTHQLFVQICNLTL